MISVTFTDLLLLFVHCLSTAWLISWLADNLGYDVTSIVALPYDWRLSPNKMEARDGFLTLTRKKIEAAVESNGRPGIMVAHSVSTVDCSSQCVFFTANPS